MLLELNKLFKIYSVLGKYRFKKRYFDQAKSNNHRRLELKSLKPKPYDYIDLFQNGEYGEVATATNKVVFTVQENNGSNQKTKDADYYIDKFYNAYKNYFGNKSGSSYVCYTTYKCQNFNTGKTIAVHKSTYDMYWYDDQWYYHGEGSQNY